MRLNSHRRRSGGHPGRVPAPSRDGLRSGQTRTPSTRLLSLLCFSALLGAACVEQDDDKPTEEDMKVAKQNLLTTAPTPKYAVNADLDGKVVYLGLDVDPATIEPGRDVKLTHYWKLVASPGEGWKTFTHLEGPNHQN